MSSVNVTTADGRNDYSSFDVNITEPGSWWIHVFQKIGQEIPELQLRLNTKL